jgi:small-conductance mechanosensitive channel
MRTTARNLILFGLLALLIAALIGFVLTRPTARPGAAKGVPQKPTTQAKLVDRSPLETAHSLAPIASTAAEQRIAAEATRVADHEVDLAFASALQRAQDEPPADRGEIKQINDKIHRLEDHLRSVQEQADRLGKLAANPGKKDLNSIQQQLAMAQARAALLQDVLDDAKQELIRAGGDPQAQIRQELDEHEAAEHNIPAVAQNKPVVFQVEGSLLLQFRTWQRLREDRQRLLEAQKQAKDAVQMLTRKHQALEKGLPETFDTEDDDSEESAPTDEAQHAAALATLHQLSGKTRMLSVYDKRIQAEKQLADLYGGWGEVVNGQIRVVLHSIIRSLLWILLALIGIALAEGLIERYYLSLGADRRRLGTMRLVLRFVSQVIGVLVILLVLFGVPSQLSTVLALAGAGLTVALKDFIVAFFGWFVLMGRHGIRSGDWVEINGVGGEVVEVGLLRTILLETGNWNDAGHPTGRKVAFVNSFAIEGHYFNFTTSGQWLWDELDVLIPAGEDPYYLTTAVLKLVTEQTRADAVLAEQEWQRVTHHSATQGFSAAPAINVRPTNLGVNLVVRYVVNAHNRYEVRTRLYQAIVRLLHGKGPAKAEEETVPGGPVRAAE